MISSVAILRTSPKISFFPVLDNAYSNFFGFTYSEVYEMLEYYNMTDKEKELKEWYDGYIFGNEEIYNPWSVISYIAK